MIWYKCLIEGKNFPGELIGENTPIGFYITRFVQATTAEEAELLALEMLKGEASLQIPEGVSPSKEAKVYFEEIVEVPSEAVPETKHGFAFYVMDT